MALFRRRTRAISSRSTAGSSTRAGRVVLFVMGGIFTAVGAAVGYFLLVQPLLLIQSAKGWGATPCVIESSAVVTHSGDDSDTYSVHIVYRYTVNGTEYTSDRYHFMIGSTSGRSGKQAVVDRYPPGTEATCYVDPADPTQAVIDRGYTSDMLFGLIPLVFFVAGVAMLVGATRVGRGGTGQKLFPAAGRNDEADTADAAFSQPVVLHSGKSRRTKLVVMCFLAAIWNGISWTILVVVYNEGEWVPFAFLSLFCLVGIGLVGGVVHSALALLNPTVTLRLDSAAVTLGGPISLTWELSGNVGRLDRFRIFLEGREEATYRRGTDTVTDKHVFRTIDLLDLTDTNAILNGRGRVDAALPGDTMHSWTTSRNKIVWSLKAAGTIRRWPDVNDEFDFTVLPISERALATESDGAPQPEGSAA